MTRIKLIIFIACALVMLLSYLLFRGCGDEVSVVDTPVTNTLQQVHALQVEIGKLNADKAALQEANNTNHATLIDLQAQWHEAEAAYITSKRSCDEAEKDRAKYFTELTTRTEVELKYQQDILKLETYLDEQYERHASLLAKLEQVKDRDNPMVSTNFTAAEQYHFYMVYDKIYWEIINE